jgi:hypothetical protein
MSIASWGVKRSFARIARDASPWPGVEPDVIRLDHLADAFGGHPPLAVQVHHRRQHRRPGHLGGIHLEDRERAVHTGELHHDRPLKDVLELEQPVPEVIDGRKVLPGLVAAREVALLRNQAARHEVFAEDGRRVLQEHALAGRRVAAVDDAGVRPVVDDRADHPLEDHGRIVRLASHEVSQDVRRQPDVEIRRHEPGDVLRHGRSHRDQQWMTRIAKAATGEHFEVADDVVYRVLQLAGRQAEGAGRQQVEVGRGEPPPREVHEDGPLVADLLLAERPG